MYRHEKAGTKRAPESIQKRDSCTETWATDRIAKAIEKALQASGLKDPMFPRRLARKVESELSGRDVVSQEEVQDTVEQVLVTYPSLKGGACRRAGPGGDQLEPA